MGILGTLERCIHSIPSDLIEGKVVYIELDKDNYEVLEVEISLQVNAEFLLKETKVADIGKCIVLNYEGYKIVISVNIDKTKMGDFYFAFKTKII
jgi:hypothetical protein